VIGQLRGRAPLRAPGPTDQAPANSRNAPPAGNLLARLRRQPGLLATPRHICTVRLACQDTARPAKIGRPTPCRSHATHSFGYPGDRSTRPPEPAATEGQLSATDSETLVHPPAIRRHCQDHAARRRAPISGQ
jgi:hypothetical protein